MHFQHRYDPGADSLPICPFVAKCRVSDAAKHLSSWFQQLSRCALSLGRLTICASRSSPQGLAGPLRQEMTAFSWRKGGSEEGMHDTSTSLRTLIDVRRELLCHRPSGPKRKQPRGSSHGVVNDLMVKAVGGYIISADNHPSISWIIVTVSSSVLSPAAWTSIVGLNSRRIRRRERMRRI